jgi:hypothetical protein
VTKDSEGQSIFQLVDAVTSGIKKEETDSGFIDKAVRETQGFNDDLSEAEKAKRNLEARIENARLKRMDEDILDLQQDRNERQKYADSIFKLVRIWLVGVSLLVVLSGLSSTQINFDNSDIPVIHRVYFRPQFQISDKILLAIIGGTSVNIIGLFVIVTNYLFNSPNKKDSSK